MVTMVISFSIIAVVVSLACFELTCLESLAYVYTPGMLRSVWMLWILHFFRDSPEGKSQQGA